MQKLSPREAVKMYQVSRATLTKALRNGTISAEKSEAGHWQIDPSELRRVYPIRPTENPRSRASQKQLNQNGPHQKDSVDQDVIARLARTEAELSAEREKNALLQRHLDDVRRMLPPPDAKTRRRWWPF